MRVAVDTMHGKILLEGVRVCLRDLGGTIVVKSYTDQADLVLGNSSPSTDKPIKLSLQRGTPGSRMAMR